MRRGAFTLIEVMVVVLLVAAISAVFLPTLATRMTDGKLGHAVRSLESGAALAAAQAMEQSTIVAYVAERWDQEWVLWAEVVETEAVGELVVGGLGAVESWGDPLRKDSPVQREELASFSGVHLTDTLPPVLAAASDSELVDRAEEMPRLPGGEIFEPGGGEVDRYVLSIFFADGSCRIGPTMYLVAEDGTRKVIRQHPLTGRLKVRRLSSVHEEVQQLEEAEEVEPMVPIPAEPRAEDGESARGPRHEP